MSTNDLGIRLRVLVLALMATGLTAYFTLARHGELDRYLEERSLAQASQLAQSCEYALFSGDVAGVGQLARTLAKSDEMRWASRWPACLPDAWAATSFGRPTSSPTPSSASVPATCRRA